MNPLFKVFLNGVQARGTGGVVFVDAEEAGYLFPNELTGDSTFRGNIEALVSSAEEDKNFLIVEKCKTEMKVHCYPRTAILEEFAQEVSAAGTAAAETRR